MQDNLYSDIPADVAESNSPAIEPATDPTTAENKTACQPATFLVTAGFFPRLSAYLIDSLLCGILDGIATLFLWTNPAAALPIFFSLSILDMLPMFIFGMYFSFLTGLCGTTIGKKMLRLKVVNSDEMPISKPMALYRETIGRFLSSVLLIGYLVLLFDKKKRALHDWLCDTRVVYNLPKEDQK